MPGSKKPFRPKAHILRLLGEELIKSPTMAIYELIKNSYDADATHCSIVFSQVEQIENSRIVIIDDGLGITEEVLENVWLEPGTDHRKSINQDGTRTIHKSKLFGRIPTGEKGVGRFAVHRLGNRIELITRPAKVIELPGGTMAKELLDYELVLSIDWDVFTQGQYLDTVFIEWEKKYSDFYFTEDSGTRIEISGLREAWTRGMARKLKRNTLSMLSPKASKSGFEIKLNFGNNWLQGIPKAKQLLDAAPYQMTVLLDEEYNMSFEYSFKPLLNKDVGWRELPKKNKYDTNVRGLIRPFIRAYYEELESDEDYVEEELKRFDKEPSPIGELMIELFSYDRDSRSLRDSYGEPKTLDRFVRGAAGIRVFKDYLRIFDYGEPGNDWLGLDLDRVNRKEWFSNNQSIGFIYLQAESATKLVEKTNREGFIENRTFHVFYRIVRYILTQFKAERFQDSQRWREFHKGEKKKSVPDALRAFFKTLNSIEFKSDTDRKKLESAARVVDSSYKQKEETLLLPAGVGLTASVALHEIEKLVPRLAQTVEESPINSDLAKNQVAELRQYTEGILSILRSGGNKEISVVEAIRIALSNYEYKLMKRRISLKVEVPDTVYVKCDRRYFITVFLNLIDNSIYWLDSVYEDEKTIFISCEEHDKHVSIVFADNGPGFLDTPETLLKPFRSRKEGGTGLGLYIIDTIMIQYGKLKLHESFDTVGGHSWINNGKGAIVELVFSKKK